QRPGDPLERGPRPLQSCMITTAGNGPAPSGLTSSNGICSDVPFGVVVVSDGPDEVEAQPTAARPSASPAAASRSLIAGDCMPITGERSPRRARPRSAARLEVLDRALVRFGFAPAPERPEVPALARLGIPLSRIEPVTPAAQLLNHRSASSFHSYQPWTPPSIRRVPQFGVGRSICALGSRGDHEKESTTWRTR